MYRRPTIKAAHVLVYDQALLCQGHNILVNWGWNRGRLEITQNSTAEKQF